MIIVTYNPMYGEAVADGHCENVAKDIVDAIRHEDACILNYSTGNIFQVLLMYIALEVIQPQQIELRMAIGDETRVIEVNQWGAVPDWPEGFIDLETRMATKRLATQHRRQFEERRLKCQNSTPFVQSKSENS